MIMLRGLEPTPPALGLVDIVHSTVSSSTHVHLAISYYKKKTT